MKENTNPNVDWFFEKPSPWQKAYRQLRKIVLDCGLTEELKWGKPCYTFQGKNVLLIHGFKDYCAVLFHKGALLQDTEGILVQQTEHVQAARQVRFAGVQEIAGLQHILKRYIYEAIAAEEAGLRVPLKKTKEFGMPEELRQKLKEVPGLKQAFEALTPGRQRGYLLYFSSAKRPETRANRVEKYIPAILRGKGLDDV